LKAGIAAGVGAGLGISGYKYAPGILSARNRDDRPNIVMVTMDTTRYDRMGFNGYERDTTPNLDKIAEQGVVFHKNYSQAPFTSPSTASFMTSRYPSDLNGITNRKPKLGDEFTTLAEMLKNRGYSNFGSTSSSRLSKEYGFSQGFDHFSSPGTPEFPAGIRFGEETIKWIINEVSQKGSEDNPNFFWVHFYDPHSPYAAPEEFTFKFHTEGKFDDTDKGFYGFLEASDGSFDGERAAIGPMTEKEVVKHSDMYDGQVLYTDHQIDRFLKFLKRSDFFDSGRDLVVLTADHGELLGEYDCFALHEGGYQEVTHIPLMLFGAGFPKGKSLDTLTANLDVLPTIIDIVDSKYDGEAGRIDKKEESLEWRGKSLNDLINGRETKLHDVVHTELTYGEGHVVHTDRYSLIKRVYKPVKLDSNDSFSPSGSTLKYNSQNGDVSVTFKWPDDLRNDISKDESLQIQLNLINGDESLDIVGLPDTFMVGEYQGTPISSSFCMRNAPFFRPETRWNTLAAFERIKWNLQLVSNAGSNSERVLFDSSYFGHLEFKLEPTENFDLLFDLREIPSGNGFVKERENHYKNPNYEDVRKELEKVAIDHLRGLNEYSYSFLVKNSNFEETEQLQSLGYL